MELLTSLAQLMTAVLFVVPGGTYAAARRRLRGPVPEDLDPGARITRALGAGVVFDALYLLVLGRHLAALATTRPGQSGLARLGEVAPEAGGLALLLLVLVPAAAAVAAHVLTPLVSRRIHGLYNPVPTSWDFSLPRQGQVFVRALLPGDRWAGGWLDAGSFASGFPQPRDLFVQEAWQLGEDGSFVAPQPQSRGIWIDCADATVVEFVGPVPADDLKRPRKRAAPRARRAPSVASLDPFNAVPDTGGAA